MEYPYNCCPLRLGSYCVHVETLEILKFFNLGAPTPTLGQPIVWTIWLL